MQADLSAAGHELKIVASVGAARGSLDAADVLIVDLTDEQFGGVGAAEEIRAQRGDDCEPRLLGFYSHVDVATRERAQQAGFDLIVPRSRMAREGATLVARLSQDC